MDAIRIAGQGLETLPGYDMKPGSEMPIRFAAVTRHHQQPTSTVSAVQVVTVPCAVLAGRPHHEYLQAIHRR